MDRGSQIADEYQRFALFNLRSSILDPRSSPPWFLLMARRVLVKLPGPVRALEFMALAGNARQRPDHEKQGQQFHRAAS